MSALWKGLGALAVAAVVVGCSNPAEPPTICSTEARAGLLVYVKDSVTGAPAASGTSVYAIDAKGVIDSALSSFPANRPELDAYPVPGAWEHAGVFQVVVKKAGYRDWTRSGVQITSDECHVIPVTLTALLQPL